MDILDSFDHWKEFLYGKVIFAEKMGISEENITRGVDYIQNFLAHTIEPHNPEEKLLQKLWLLGTPDERRALSSMILKLVKQEGAPEGNPNENEETAKDRAKH